VQEIDKSAKKAGLLGRAVLHGHSVHWLCLSILNHIFCIFLHFLAIIKKVAVSYILHAYFFAISAYHDIIYL